MPTIALEVFCLLADALIVATVLAGLRAALRRIEPSKAGRVRAWLAIAVPLLAWNALSLFLATRGVFAARRAAFHIVHGSKPDASRLLLAALPPILFAVVVPIVIGLWLILRSRTMAKIVDAIPLSWLVGLQIYRAIGGIFLVLWGVGALPWQFALPAGAGDVLVGVLAIPVTLMAGKGAGGSETAAYAWNLLGILDFIVALTTGFLTSPTPFQLLALEHPNVLVSRFPLVIIPAFLVPLSSIMHGLCLWKLRRMAQPSQRGVQAFEADFS